MEPAPLKYAAELLATSGAVMTVWNSPSVHYLVGDFRWADDDRIFWFAANGDTTADGHLLRFDAAEWDDGRVRFLAGQKTVALLSPIDRAEVDDRDDFHVAWSIWQQVAPARRSLMEEARTVCAVE